ncbi:hypothetical protein Pcinc_029353 [Petrolisthes cinctipes]|uniref:Uncharacterized protein n=1 Tax=Petrolisthes cinctipes TaxID=88211 RepID=A0AAE1K416_PETCI|nr:hypothetical protein Pcinc_029353 [Petrolisthes cinctipes]
MRLQHELSLLNTYQSSQLSGVSAQQLEESSASLALTVTWADLVPPLRVTDLEVIHVHNTTVNLTWWWQRTQKIRLVVAAESGGGLTISFGGCVVKSL